MARQVGYALALVGLLLVGIAAPGSSPLLTGADQCMPTPTGTRPPAGFARTGGLTPNTPSLRISPAVVQVQPGQTFDLQILVSDPKMTRGAQFGLCFDPALLELTGVAEGTYYHDWAQRQGASTMTFPGVQIDAEKGTVAPFAIVLMGGATPEGPAGTGLLATIHARARIGVVGPASITLDQAILSEVRVRPGGAGVEMASAPSLAVADAIVVVGSATGLAPTAPTPRLVPSTPTALVDPRSRVAL